MVITKNKRLIKFATLPVIAVLVFTVSVLVLQRNNTAEAIVGWKAGNIMDDIVMSDSGTLSVSQIQSFLNSKNPSCDTNGTKPASEFGRPDLTHAQYAKAVGWQAPPYICLKDYKQNNKTSAQIIYDAAQEFHINPQVLIVLLQKEQSLVTDTWPLNGQYKTATGYGCPDTAPCDSQYFGLTNQIRWSGRMFRAILDASPTWYTPYTLGTNYIQYNPNKSCGGSNVYIENRATQALYNYTPYQPNKGALNAGWGTASCGAYGNRNFYLYFSDWFASTHARFTNLKEPRWMRAKTDIYKRNPATGENIDAVIAAGTQIYFPTKITVSGSTYLRTQHDTDAGIGKGVLLSDLEEIPMNYTPLKQPRWMEATEDIVKVDPRTGQKIPGTIPAGTKIFFPTKITVGQGTYLRTQHDTDAGDLNGLPIEKLKDTTIEYTSLTTPRWLEAKTDSSEINLVTKDSAGSAINAGEQRYFKYKIVLNDLTFVTDSLPGSNELQGIPYTDLKNIPATYTDLQSPRWMVVKTDTHKRNPMTEQEIGDLLPAGLRTYFPTKITVGGKTYLKTQYGTDRNLNEGILISDLSEYYVNMVSPRTMTTTSSTYRRVLSTGEQVGAVIPAGTQLSFKSKVIVGKTTYLRTLNDTDSNIDAVIPMSMLR